MLLQKKEATESVVAEARSTLRNATINLSYTLIHAPFDGYIDRINYKTGSLINSGTLLTSISNIDEVFGYFRVSETEYLQLINKELDQATLKDKQQKVSLILADGTTYRHEGAIEAMEGDIDRETGSIAFRARFPNPEKLLKHGASGKIVIVRKVQNAVLVPQGSVFNVQDKIYVYKVGKNGLVTATNFISLGRYKSDFIAGALHPGDTILLEGIQHIRNGQRIKPMMVNRSPVNSKN